MRYSTLLLLVLVIVIAPSLPAAIGVLDDRDDVCATPYEKTAESILDGIVEAIGSEPSGTGYCVYLRLVRGEVRFKVYVGPREFVTRVGFMPTLGDRVQVTGAPVEGAAKAILARTIRTGTGLLVLRDQNGMPLWMADRPVEMDPEIGAGADREAMVRTN